MSKRVLTTVAMLTTLAVPLAASALETPYAMLASRVIGRVVNMSQTSKDGKSTFDTANVIVDVPLDKVYATLRGSLERAQSTEGIRIVRVDDDAHVVEFSRGDRKATIQVVVLGDNLAHLMVSSVTPTPKRPKLIGNEKAPTPVIVERILKVCKEMGKECFAGQ